MLVLAQSVDWAAVGKTWGPMGVGFVLFIVLVWQGAKMARQMLQDTITDARKERDLSRQLLKEQATEFVSHLRFRDDKLVEQLKGVTEALDRIGRKR